MFGSSYVAMICTIVHVFGSSYVAVICTITRVIYMCKLLTNPCTWHISRLLTLNVCTWGIECNGNSDGICWHVQAIPE